MRRLTSLLTLLIAAGIAYGSGAPAGAGTKAEGAAAPADAPAEATPPVQLDLPMESSAMRLQALLTDIETITSEFEQITQNPQDRVVQESSGELWVRSPTSFRIETREPFAQTLVSDGDSLWTFDEELAQVIIANLETDVSEVPILLLGGKSEEILAQYDVTGFADEEGHHFVLTPKGTGGLFETMTVTFEDDLPTRIMIRDSLGQSTVIRLQGPVVNEPVDDDRFKLEIPDGVDVIDDRIAQ